ncbi:MAG: Hsp20/alpha crystallin family protein [Clostridia bacterium]|nr:Hsp20/alpha crystallin family protein [Clostridia bacterium]
MKDYPEKRHCEPDRRPPHGMPPHGMPPRDMHPYHGPFHDPFFDDLDDFFKPMFFNEPSRMRTDIKETKDGYQLAVELPGYDKKDIHVTLEDGYLTVSAQKSDKQEPDRENGEKYVLKECNVSCRRSYYVGEDIEQDKIKAKYENGVLCLTLPKEEPKIHGKNIEIE